MAFKAKNGDNSSGNVGKTRKPVTRQSEDRHLNKRVTWRPPQYLRYWVEQTARNRKSNVNEILSLIVWQYIQTNDPKYAQIYKTGNNGNSRT